MKRALNLLLLVMFAIAGLVGPTSAREYIPLLVVSSDTLWAIRATEDDSWKLISIETGISVSDLIRWNGILKPRPPFINEQVYINDPSLMGISRWNKPGGAPARGTVKEQIELLDIPDGAKSLLRMQVEVEMEPAFDDTIRSSPDNPLILMSVTQHDERRDVDIAKGITVCKWYREKTNPTPEEVRTKQVWEPIYYLIAQVWDPVIYDGKYWTLQHYQVCNNIAVPIPTPVPEPPPPPPLAVVEAPPPPPAPPAPAPAPLASKSDTAVAPPTLTLNEEPKKPRDFYEHGDVFGVVQEKILHPSDDDHFNVYVGGDYVLYTSHANLYNKLGWAIRLVGQVQHSNNLGISARTGPRVRLLDIAHKAGLDLEAGAWYESEQREWHGAPYRLPDGRYASRDSAAFLSDYGPFVRVLGWAPDETFFEGTYQKGRMKNAFYTAATVEPARLYLYGTYEGKTNDQRSKFTNSHTVAFPAERVRLGEFKIGYKITDKVVPYVIPRRWLDYTSNVYEADRNAFGVGIQYRPKRGLTFDLNGSKGKNHELDKASTPAIHHDIDEYEVEGRAVLAF